MSEFESARARRVLFVVATLLIPIATRAQNDSAEVASRRGLVASVSGLASDVGASILARGGNAIDAAVATGFALAVTHPSAGNIGGGGFMLIRLASGEASSIDYREKAPSAATPGMYLGSDGQITRALTDSGWLAPGVPGTVRGLALAHTRYGKLAWRDVVLPAAELAEQGFPLSTALSASLNGALGRSPGSFPSTVATYGKPGGGAWVAGDTLRLPQLARALRAIAADGPDAFYTGWIADSIDAAMRQHRGMITRADLANYRAIERAPVKGTYNNYEIVSMGPPSSGGAVLVMTFNMLEALRAQQYDVHSAESIHRRIEVARRAYLERARWIGDSDFVKVPMDRLLSKAFAAELVKTIDPMHASKSVVLGVDVVTPADESGETTHFSVVDAEGNAVSNTYTLEGGFGSGVVVAGFLLNNEMGDFNKKPGTTNERGDIGTPPNVIAPGKRMLSSMAPAIVTKNGSLFLVTGSPGGRTIPNTVISVILGATGYHLDARAAVDLPRLHHQWLPDRTVIEPGLTSEATLAWLRQAGHDITVSTQPQQGDAHSIRWDAATKTAYGARDRRSPDSKVSAPPQR